MKNLFLSPNATIKEALKKLDQTAERTILVVDNKNKLIGAISDGDVRRCLLLDSNMDRSVENIYNKKPKFVYESNYDMDSVRKLFIDNKIELLPILDNNHTVVNYITWAKAFDGKDEVPLKHEQINIPVIIMAGGKGSRLEPFTNIFPKALIPIGDKTVIEKIIDEFMKFGIRQFLFTVNYKAQIIESYFNTIDKGYEIKYIKEDRYLGTAGSLSLIKEHLNGSFIVSNCDIIVKANYADVLDFHKKQKSSLTILSSIQHHKIPYGVVNFSDGGRVTDIQEKPEFSFTINTGVYILNSEVLDLIPHNKEYDMPDLINKIRETGGKVFTYPVNENDYIDIGQWEEYKKLANKTGGA